MRLLITPNQHIVVTLSGSHPRLPPAFSESNYTYPDALTSSRRSRREYSVHLVPIIPPPALSTTHTTPTPTITIMLLPQCRQSLLLRVRIDIRPNREPNNIEEWHPCLLREELLSERESNGGGDP